MIILTTVLIILFNLFVTKKEKEKGTMEDWDQETLEKVVASKSQEYNKNKPTDIVSTSLSRFTFTCIVVLTLQKS